MNDHIVTALAILGLQIGLAALVLASSIRDVAKAIRAGQPGGEEATKP